MRWAIGMAGVLAALLNGNPVGAEATPSGAEVRIAIGHGRPQIDGALEIHWRNDGAEGADSPRFLLFPERFAKPPAWGDLARHFLLPTAPYRPGGIEISSVRVDGRPVRTERAAVGGWPDGLLTVDHRLAPGEEVVVSIRFRTMLPSLLDVFGASDRLWAADDGWYPLPWFDGGERGEGEPFRVKTRFVIERPEAGELLLDGAPVPSRIVERESDDGRLSMVLSTEHFERHDVRLAGRPVSVLWLEPRGLRHRVSRADPPLEALEASIGPIVAASRSSEPLRIVRLPLGWYPSWSSARAVFVSERLFDVHPLFRPLHQRELAYAIFLHEELRRAFDREAPEDVRWIAEGLAWRRADSLYRTRLRSGLEVQDWVSLFDVFAIVDRFGTAPRIPYLRTFFPWLTLDEPLGVRLESFPERPPGRTIFAKLEARLRPKGFRQLLGRYGSEPGVTLRELARQEGIEEFLDAWLGPPARLNFGLAEVTRNPDGQPGADLVIHREGSDARPDTIEVELREGEGRERFFVDVDEETTAATLPARAPVDAVRLDPERRWPEPRLDDNLRPLPIQLLFDSADVEVSSTEFGVSSLLVARRRYDYRKDLAVAGFYTNRAYGMTAGLQLHGGRPIDANFFRQNLFLYYSLQELDSGFRNDRTPLIRTSGRLGGVGLRYNYYDAFWFENPTGSRHLRAFFDVYDHALGADFDYLQGGAALSSTFPVREDTVLAAQVMNGFSATTGSDRIPNQGLFSLGGFRSIRGIGAEEDLAESIFLLRAELRYMLPLRFDLNFQDVLVARRLQLKAFVDAGRVENRISRLYDPQGYAVGAGAGFNLFYDFLGFFPTTFYLDVATRVDRRSSAQILFGVRQPF